MSLEISDADAPAPRALARGDELSLRLAENPTTGYRWQVTQSGTGELGLVEERFDAGSAGNAAGAGGHRLLRFVARRSGQVWLKATLRRSWDPPGTRLQERMFEIVVG